MAKKTVAVGGKTSPVSISVEKVVADAEANANIISSILNENIDNLSELRSKMDRDFDLYQETQKSSLPEAKEIAKVARLRIITSAAMIAESAKKVMKNELDSIQLPEAKDGNPEE